MLLYKAISGFDGYKNNKGLFTLDCAGHNRRRRVREQFVRPSISSYCVRSISNPCLVRGTARARHVLM